MAAESVEGPAQNVVAGLVPAIHVFSFGMKKDVDARPKAGHDEGVRFKEVKNAKAA